MIKWREESKEKVKCACSDKCDKWIPKHNNWGRENHYAFGHSKTKVKRDNPEKDCECGCGGKILTYDKSGVERHFIMNHNKRKEVTKDKNYEYVYAPDHPHRNHRNKVYRHRLIMEEFLGRYLEPGELVHHIDENPKNNDIENLLLVTRGTHMTIHKTKDMTDRRCGVCGSNETYMNQGKYAAWFEYMEDWICMKCYKKNKIEFILNKK